MRLPKLLVLLLLLSAAALAKPVKLDKIQASFQTDAVLSEPTKVGLDAYMVELNDETGKNAVLEVVVARVTKGALDNMTRNNVKPLDYAKTAFLGLSGPASGKKSRAFGKAPAEGETYKTEIPRPADVEIYFLPGPAGSRYLVAFRAYGQSARVEQVRSQVARSFTVGK